MLNVLIVEDDSMARRLLEIYINESENYRVAHSVESASMAEFYCITNKIDVILMDVCTALDANGLDAAEKIKGNFPEIKIIIITSQPECSFIDRARAIGVDSFWYKNANAEEIKAMYMMQKHPCPLYCKRVYLNDILESRRFPCRISCVFNYEILLN